MAGVKIVDLPALGRDLINTDLLEVSLNGGGSRKITGQEIMNASKLAIGSTPIVSGTVGRLLFQGAGNVLSQPSSLFYDAVNNRLGIGTTTPGASLDVVYESTFQSRIDMYGTLYMYNNITSLSGNIWLSDGYAIGDWGTGNNRIEFYNNRMSFFGNGNEALRIVGSTQNVLIGTTTDAGFKLNVNGTARVVATHQIYRNNQVGAIDLNLYNGQSGWQGGMYYNTGAGGSGQRLTFYAGGAGGSADGLTIFSNRNVLIQNGGTHTDAGFMLDVNGTGRFSGNLTVATGFQFLFNNNNVGLYRDANTLRLGGFGGIEFLASATNISAQSIRMKIFDTGNIGINTTTDAGFRLDVNGTARVQGPSGYSMTYDANGIFNLYGTYSRLDLFNSAGSLRARLNNDGPNGTLTLYQNATSYIFLNGAQSGNNSYIATALSIGNQSAANASSILELTSTTKGFLPPRMTNAQRAAIASPAVGLIVYCTDATEGLYVYKSTGWTFMV